ncbi:hypothetical protein [Rugosimonospora africana]|uniref:Uncharacterized protein n=1 Tax=Rugosimonospora africana TaxID=556532 RepID=A0A8J3QJQ3_9ACTN|nr:hypothetical protein [Rugosimonospora africana]GIH12243.1 hypothetical protein Raf01_04150 [Rugosimonospora africana]
MSGARLAPLVTMRVAGFLRTGRFIPPLLAALVLLSILYGGGQADAAEAYGVSALLMFPVLAWQTKLLLDAEPDVQRRLAVVALRSRRREAVAGLLAASVIAVPAVIIALGLPWVVNGVKHAHAGTGLLLGLWAHAIVLPPALAVGAWSSRVIATTAGRATAVLVGGAVLGLVLGLSGSPVPWLAPPLMGAARALANGIGAGALGGFTGWALVWSALVLAGYGWLRRTRA